MSAPSDLCGSCNDTRATHGHHFESECQRFRERGDSGPCPWCERTDDHAHEFVDVLSAECDHELARLRAESAELRRQLEAVDRALGLPPDRAPRRLELLIEMRKATSATGLDAALSEAEMAVVDDAIEWSRLEHLVDRRTDDMILSKESLLDSVDALLALRAAGGEAEHG